MTRPMSWDMYKRRRGTSTVRRIPKVKCSGDQGGCEYLYPANTEFCPRCNKRNPYWPDRTKEVKK